MTQQEMLEAVLSNKPSRLCSLSRGWLWRYELEILIVGWILAIPSEPLTIRVVTSGSERVQEMLEEAKAILQGLGKFMEVSGWEAVILPDKKDCVVVRGILKDGARAMSRRFGERGRL